MAKQSKPLSNLKSDDYRLLSDFRHVLRQFLAFSEEKAADFGLASQQHQALLAIKGFGTSTPTISDLAQRLVVRHHSAVGLVDRLELGDLIKRQHDNADRRRVTLRLTQKGEIILKKLTATHRDELRRIAPLLRKLLGDLSD